MHSKLILRFLVIFLAVGWISACSRPNPLKKLKSLETALVGKWAIDADKTNATPVEGGLKEKRKQLIDDGLAWEFRSDGTVVEIYGRRSSTKGYRVMQDAKGETWVLIAEENDSTLFKAKLEGPALHFTAIAFLDEGNKEIEIIGSLVLTKQ
jgi:hypothetical protein